MFVSTTSIKALPEKRKECLQTVQLLVDPIRSQRGCRTYRYYQDMENDDIFLLVGEWDTRKDFENHLKSDYFQVLQGALVLLQEPLNVKFFQSPRTNK